MENSAFSLPEQLGVQLALSLGRTEAEVEGDTDPWANSPIEVFTVNGINFAMAESPSWKTMRDFFRSQDWYAKRGPWTDTTEPEPLAHDDALRAICAEMFRAGQLSAAGKFGNTAAGAA